VDELGSNREGMARWRWQIFLETMMRIIPAAFLSIAFLGVAVSPGWCPEPADQKAPLTGSKGATAARVGPSCDHQCRLLMQTRERNSAMDRLGGGSVNLGQSGKAVGGNRPRPLGWTGAAVKPAGNAAIVQPPPKTGPDTNFSYGAGSGGGKKDVFRAPR
jgi:hypothetical protein